MSPQAKRISSLRPEETGRLRGLAAMLRQMRSTLRRVDYAQAERDCEELGALLLQAASREWLSEAAFAGIPRGGWIVLGMLSYVLDLRPEQLQPDPASATPLVIVDDCAFTGLRFAEALARSRSESVVFAHLYSHAELRRAILSREARVRHCVAAHDLLDHAREQYPDAHDYRRWQDWCRAQSDPREYWHGQPDFVCFAWSEPLRAFWNPLTGRTETGWRFLAPHACLGNRAALGLPPVARANRLWQPVPHAAWAWFDGVLWLCDTQSGNVYALRGVAADMWRGLAGYGDPEAVIAFLAERYDVSGDRLRGDLEGFIASLGQNGLLQSAVQGPGA